MATPKILIRRMGPSVATHVPNLGKVHTLYIRETYFNSCFLRKNCPSPSPPTHRCIFHSLLPDSEKFPQLLKSSGIFFAEEVDSGQIFTKGAEKYFFLLQILAGKEVYFINFRIRDTIFLDSSWFRLKNINKKRVFYPNFDI